MHAAKVKILSLIFFVVTSITASARIHCDLENSVWQNFSNDAEVHQENLLQAAELQRENFDAMAELTLDRCYPINYIDPLGLVDWPAALNATAGIIGNGFGVAGSGAVIGSTGGVGTLVVGGVMIKSSYGLGANISNLNDALHDRKPGSTGALFNDIAKAADPCNETAQKAATILDLAFDLGGSRAARLAATPSLADQFGGPLLEGGASLGPTFMGNGQAAVNGLGFVQTSQTILPPIVSAVSGDK